MKILAGLYKNRSLFAPKDTLTRPTSSRLRETLFNICQAYIQELHFLDLFAGSGSMGLEALSRGANSATFIDHSAKAIACIKRNAALLQVEHKCRILQGDMIKKLEMLFKQGKKFDLIYIDPPYNLLAPNSQPYNHYLLHWLDNHFLLAQKGFVFVEDSSATSVTNLQNLIWMNSRNIGSTFLHQYVWMKLDHRVKEN